MQRATLVTLLLLTIGLGAFVYFYEIRGEPERKAAADAEKRLFDIDKDTVTHIDLTNAYGHLVFDKDDSGWNVTFQQSARADTSAVEDVIAALDGLRIAEDLGTTGDLDAYGLTQPSIVVTVSAGDDSYRLEVGEDTPIGGKTYVRTGDKPGVILVSYPLRSKLNKPFDDWRDKDIVSFTPSKVTRIRIAPAGGSAYEVARDGASWKLTSPPHHRLDARHFDGLLYDLDGLRAVEFTGSTDAAAYGLAPPAWTVTVVETLEGKEVPHTLLFGQADSETRRVPVITAPGQEIRLTRVSVLDRLDKPLDSLREKRVVPLERFVIGKLSLTLDGETLDATKTTDETWTLAGSLKAKAHPKDVESILDDLADLEADTLIDDVPETEWGQFGLDSPFLTAVMSETDPDGKVVKTSTLYLGEASADGKISLYARVEGDPTIYHVNRFVADDLRALLLQQASSTPHPGAHSD